MVLCFVITTWSNILTIITVLMLLIIHFSSNIADWLHSKELTEVFRIWPRSIFLLVMFYQVLNYWSIFAAFTFIMYDNVWQTFLFVIFFFHLYGLNYVWTMLRNKVLFICLDWRKTQLWVSCAYWQTRSARNLPRCTPFDFYISTKLNIFDASFPIMRVKNSSVKALVRSHIMNIFL